MKFHDQRGGTTTIARCTDLDHQPSMWSSTESSPYNISPTEPMLGVSATKNHHPQQQRQQGAHKRNSSWTSLVVGKNHPEKKGGGTALDPRGSTVEFNPNGGIYSKGSQGGTSMQSSANSSLLYINDARSTAAAAAIGRTNNGQRTGATTNNSSNNNYGDHCLSKDLAAKQQPADTDGSPQEAGDMLGGVVSTDFFFVQGASYYKFGNESVMGELGGGRWGGGGGGITPQMQPSPAGRIAAGRQPSYGSSYGGASHMGAPLPAQRYAPLYAPMPAGRSVSYPPTLGGGQRGTAIMGSGPVAASIQQKHPRVVGASSTQLGLPPRGGRPARQQTPAFKPASAASSSDGRGGHKRDRMQELRGWWARPYSRLCCLACIVLAIAALVVAFVLTQALGMPRSMEFAWLAPAEFSRTQQQGGQTTPTMVHMNALTGGEHQQVRFELIGNGASFKSNFVSVLDFKTNKIAIHDSSLRVDGRTVACFLMDLDRSNIPDVYSLQKAARNSADKRAQTSGWTETWNYLPAQMTNQQAISRFFQPEVPECKGSRWVELQRVTANQQASKCTECFDFCLPDYGIQGDPIRGESFLNILRKACFYLYVPEWNKYATKSNPSVSFPNQIGAPFVSGGVQQPPQGGIGGPQTPWQAISNQLPQSIQSGVSNVFGKVGSVVGSAMQGAVEGVRTDPNIQKIGNELESKWINLGQVPGRIANATREAFQQFTHQAGNAINSFQPPMDFNQWRQQQQQNSQQQSQFPQQPQSQWPPHQTAVSNSNAGLFNPLSSAHGVVPQMPLSASSQYAPVNLAQPAMGIQNLPQQEQLGTFSGGSLGPSYNEQLERLRQQQGSTFPGAAPPPLSMLLANQQQQQPHDSAQSQQQQQYQSSRFQPQQPGPPLTAIFSGQAGQYTPSGLPGPMSPNSNVGFNSNQVDNTRLPQPSNMGGPSGNSNFSSSATILG